MNIPVDVVTVEPEVPQSSQQSEETPTSTIEAPEGSTSTALLDEIGPFVIVEGARH